MAVTVAVDVGVPIIVAVLEGAKLTFSVARRVGCEAEKGGAASNGAAWYGRQIGPGAAASSASSAINSADTLLL